MGQRAQIIACSSISRSRLLEPDISPLHGVADGLWLFLPASNGGIYGSIWRANKQYMFVRRHFIYILGMPAVGHHSETTAVSRGAVSTIEPLRVTS